MILYLLNHKICGGTPCNNDELLNVLKEFFVNGLREWVVTYIKILYLTLLKFYFKMLYFIKLSYLNGHPYQVFPYFIGVIKLKIMTLRKYHPMTLDKMAAYEHFLHRTMLCKSHTVIYLPVCPRKFKYFEIIICCWLKSTFNGGYYKLTTLYRSIFRAYGRL